MITPSEFKKTTQQLGSKAQSSSPSFVISQILTQANHQAGLGFNLLPVK